MHRLLYCVRFACLKFSMKSNDKFERTYDSTGNG